MVRRRLVALSALLALLLLACASASAQDRGFGARLPTPAEAAYVRAHSFQVTYVAPNDLSRARAQEEATRLGVSAAPMTLPGAVDNSTRPEFPPIGNQGGQGSCTAFATAYYGNTFTQAMDEGYTASGGNASRLCSPAFLYDLLNDGIDGGSYLGEAMTKLSEVGCASLADQPYNDWDYTAWPSGTAWVHALKNRTGSTGYFDGSTPEGIAALKQHLANGHLAAMALSVYNTWYEDYYLLDAPGISNGVYYAADGALKAGHALAIVGYDDAKAYVDSRDGKTHYGAFLLANSWSSAWGTTNSAGKAGYLWIAYEYFLEPGSALWYYGDHTIWFAVDRPHYRPLLYATVGIDHAQRGSVSVMGSIVGTSTRYAPFAVSLDGGPDLPISSANPIAVDLTDCLGVMPASGNATVKAILRVDLGATSNGTIASADFYADIGGTGTYTHTASTTPPVTVGPDHSNNASVSLGPLGIDYQLLGWHLPVGLTWETSGQLLAEVLNESPLTWDTAGAYQLRARDSINRWGLLTVPIGATLPPGSSYDYDLALIAPPVSTLTYFAPVNLASPPVPEALPVDLFFSHGSTSLVGLRPLSRIFVARFSDVLPATAGAWAAGEIEECAGRVPFIVAGYSDGSFRPGVVLNRAQLAAFLQRALKLPLAGSDADYHLTFSDTSTSTPFWKEIQALIDAGIVSGYASDNTYRPAYPVNRGQMAQFLVKSYLNGAPLPDYLGSPHFSDVPSSYTFYDAIEYGYGHNLIRGYADSTYRPTNPVNRGQIAVFIYRAFLQPPGSVVVLAGPAVTAQDPSAGGRCGWASVPSGSAANPGFAYAAFDAVRMDTSLAVGGSWNVSFELRRASAPDTPALAPYRADVAVDSATLGTVVTNALASGVPYYVIPWDIPAGLASDSYVLVVSAEDRDGQLWPVNRTPAFTITP